MQYNRDCQSSATPFSSTRDLDVLLEETESIAVFKNSYLNNVLDTSYIKTTSISNNINVPLMENSPPSILTSRRARAGTMPSMIPVGQPFIQLNNFQVKNPVPVSNNRHRSGSLTLPVPPSGYSWRAPVTEPISPSTEQFLKQGDDIALTLRSIGLDDDKDIETDGGGSSSLSSASTSIATPSTTGSPSILLPQNKPVSLRSRSQSVNNANFYQENQQQSSFFRAINCFSTSSISNNSTVNNINIDNNSLSIPTPNNATNNRPRSVSMGRMDYMNNNRAPTSGLSTIWKSNLETVHDVTLYENISTPETGPTLSVGDSELLANMLQNTASSNENNESQNNLILNSELEIDNKVSTNTSDLLLNTMNLPINLSAQNNTGVSRSLWVGNIDPTLTVEYLTMFFSVYGQIESVRLLLEKECAFINFFNIEDAINAKEDVLSNLAGRIGSCIVRIGFGRVENLLPPTTTIIETPVVSHPTRSLWLGNMPSGTTEVILKQVFVSFGTIESIRVLSQKNCAFINFETVESASIAREALIQNDPLVKELWGVRIGFAKVPVNNTKLSGITNKQLSSGASSDSNVNVQLNQELRSILQRLGAQDSALEVTKSLYSASYFESIPPVPEYGMSRKFDSAKLKEIRKNIDTLIANEDTAGIDMIAMECMDEIAELSSDYIGNTISQRLFEKCSTDVKTAMLKIVAPHLAALGVHKNGTWAAQKIIDSLTTPEQIQIVCVHIQPFIPPLMLDQFGNYVVQCCLKLECDNQYIINAMVDKLVHIAQGRFGARAIRGILESSLITTADQLFLAASLIQNSALLSLQSNGVILISWLIESSTLNNHLILLSEQLTSNIIQTATHKLGSQVLLKLINQDNEPEARKAILNALYDAETMSDILRDQSRGLNFAIKVISSEYLTADEKIKLGGIAHPILTQLQGIEFKKALVEFSTIADK